MASHIHHAKKFLNLLATPAFAIPSVLPLLFGIAMFRTKADLFNLGSDPEWKQYADLFKNTQSFGLVDYSLQFYTTVLGIYFWIAQFTALMWAVVVLGQKDGTQVVVTSPAKYWLGTLEGLCIGSGVFFLLFVIWLLLGGALGKLEFVKTYVDSGITFGEWRWPRWNVILFVRLFIGFHSIMMIKVAANAINRNTVAPTISLGQDGA
ncbi:MAG: hypothetical protein K1X78_10175 [Verrucomicrobiaceae bacterium]|nr:hypothetical protein [Verrucomicrobiaceae bacterium]